MNSIKLFFSLFALFACAASIAIADEENHNVVIKEPIVDPNFEMAIDGKQVLGSYYDKSLVHTDYTPARKEFDNRLIQALTSFAYEFSNDVVVKKSYILTIGPKYIAKLASLIGKFLPEFNRQIAAGGPDVKNGFVGDVLQIWTNISKLWLVDEELKAKIKREIPKDKNEFISRFRDFLDTCKIIVKENPMGIYLDWNHVEVEGKTIAELGAPFVMYLQENGHKRAVSILDSFMTMLAKLNPAS